MGFELSNKILFFQWNFSYRTPILMPSNKTISSISDKWLPLFLHLYVEQQSTEAQRQSRSRGLEFIGFCVFSDSCFESFLHWCFISHYCSNKNKSRENIQEFLQILLNYSVWYGCSLAGGKGLGVCFFLFFFFFFKPIWRFLLCEVAFLFSQPVPRS